MNLVVVVLRRKGWTLEIKFNFVDVPSAMEDVPQNGKSDPKLYSTTTSAETSQKFAG
jgi:hypothetical protein